MRCKVMPTFMLSLQNTFTIRRRKTPVSTAVLPTEVQAMHAGTQKDFSMQRSF